MTNALTLQPPRNGDLGGTSAVVQHGFYARPRLRLWSIGWFADSFAPLLLSGLPRRGGNVFFFGKLLGVAMTFGFGEKRCRKNLPLGGVSLLVRNAFYTILLLIAIPVFILFLPFIIPWSAYADWRDQRALAARTCDDCGTPFGREEIDRARNECHDRTRPVVAAIMARGGRPRTVPVWHLKCPNCGAEFGYAPTTANFFRRKDAA